jgi:hypothetical protein
MAAADAAQYAQALRRELIEGLGLGDLDDIASSGGGSEQAYDDLPGGSGAAGPVRLRDLDKDLEALSGNEIIHDVLEAGRVPREYAADVEARLRGAELESIQDYIAEADTLVALHGQVRGAVGLETAAGTGQCEG